MYIDEKLQTYMSLLELIILYFILLELLFALGHKIVTLSNACATLQCRLFHAAQDQQLAASQ